LSTKETPELKKGTSSTSSQSRTEDDKSRPGAASEARRPAYSYEDSAKAVFSARTTCGAKPKGRQRHEEPSTVKAEGSKGRTNPRTDI
jgi:hypothetical protein